jgi:hypothetical protein
MQTEVVPVSDDVKGSPALKRLLEQRTMSEESFVERFSSGTLRKNRRLGFAWRSQYLEERISYEFGYSFRCAPKSYLTFGDAFTEGDCPQITEVGWVLDRYLARHPFPEDRFQVKYIKLDGQNGPIAEGIGLVLFETSAPFIPAGHVVFAIIADWDVARKTFREHLCPVH